LILLANLNEGGAVPKPTDTDTVSGRGPAERNVTVRITAYGVLEKEKKSERE